MKPVQMVAALACLSLLLTAGVRGDKRPANAAPANADAAKAGPTQPVSLLQKKKSKRKKTTRKFRGRLPAYFGKVGVNDEQRSKIYGIQKDYSGKINALRKQLAEVTSQRDRDIEAVLTPDQRTKLAELRSAAKKKRGSRKSSKKKKSSP